MNLIACGNKSSMDFSGTGTIKLAQEDALPGPERNLTAIYRDDHAGPHQARHEVAGAVPFTVRVICLTAGNEPLQIRDHVLHNRRIRILVDRHPGGCVRDENIDETVPSVFFLEHILHLVCDLDELNRLI